VKAYYGEDTVHEHSRLGKLLLFSTDGPAATQKPAKMGKRDPRIAEDPPCAVRVDPPAARAGASPLRASCSSDSLSKEVTAAVWVMTKVIHANSRSVY